MRVGVIGLGVVGSAVYNGFKKLGHVVLGHDIKLNTSLEDLQNTDLCFICVPTPSREDGSCDISIVEQVVVDLISKNYEGVICIKSTVTPGTTKKLQDKHSYKNICFVPEFLKERSAEDDFINKHDLCVIGTSSLPIYELVRDCHGHYPKKFKMLFETEAELCKYFNNTYNATLVTFANSFYEVCKKLDCDYSKIKNAMISRNHINDVYIDCNESLRGFGGMCLPKDTKALNNLIHELKLNIDFFGKILEENNKYEVTVFNGMRKE
tara:strand:- start:495 stop:1292 length:798 start_codon:yes stop_codon:yes gene_type:complete